MYLISYQDVLFRDIAVNGKWRSFRLGLHEIIAF